MSDDFIRVKDKSTGHEYTIRAERFDDEAHTKTDKPALTPTGERIPPKFKTTVAQAAGKKSVKSAATSGQQAESEKE